MTRQVIIALTGLAGSGKTLAARRLVDRHRFTRLRFADPIKRMLAAGFGLSAEQLDGNEKAVPVPELSGLPPRKLMQSLGDWGRHRVGPQVWVMQLLRMLPGGGPLVVVDDVRTALEVEALRALGAVVWRVSRPGLVPGDHITEREVEVLREDELLVNATSVAALHRSVDALLGRLVGFEGQDRPVTIGSHVVQD